METAGRGAGFGVSESFIQYATGYDFHHTALQFDFGDSVEIPDISHQKSIAAIRYIETKPGKFYGIQNSSNVELTILLSPGSQMSKPSTDADRMAYFFICGKDYETIEKKINDVMEKLEYDIGA